MIGRISVAVIAICIGACASSGPEAPAPAAAASPPAVDAVASDKPVAAPAGEIHDIDAPNVPMTANVPPGAGSDEIVCRREIVTGTRMRETVCRKRSDIEERAGDDQKSLRNMRQSGSQMERDTAN